MIISKTEIDGIYLISLAAKEDERGYFMRTYDARIFRQHGLQTAWQQENQSLSPKKGTLRGLHYQRGAAAETRLVRVLAGSIFDVAVDLREGSPTFGRHVAVTLSAENRLALYIPKGCAHGFCTLSENTMVAYKADHEYVPAAEGALLWSDPRLEIPWPLKSGSLCLSEKDARAPRLEESFPQANRPLLG